MVRKKYGIWLGMLMMLLLAVCLTIKVISLPYMAIELKVESDKWIVSQIYDDSWAASEGVKVGDILVAVDHRPPDIERLSRERDIDSIKSMDVNRNGTLLQFNFSNPYTQPISMNQLVIPLSLFIVLFSFSSFILYKKPDDRAAILLTLFLMFVAIGYLATGGASRGDRVAQTIEELTITLASAVFIHFLHNYFSRAGIYVVNCKAVYIWYFITTALSVVFLVDDLNLVLIFEKPGSTTIPLFSMFCSGMIFASIIQVRMYIRYRNTPHHALLKYMMIGNIGAFMPLISLIIIPALIFRRLIINPGVAGAFLSFLPLTYSYLVASNQLLDIDFIMSRLRYFYIIALLPTLAIVVGIGLMFYDREIQAVQWVQTFLVAYVAIVLFLYAKEMLDRNLRNKVVKGLHEFEQSIESFPRRVTNVMKVSELEQCLANELLGLLPIHSIGFIERQIEGNIVTLKSRKGVESLESLLPEIHDSLPVRLSVGDAIKLSRGYCYMIGLGRGMQQFVWIDDKANHMEYNHDERVWLRTVITHVGFVYQNLQLIEGLVHDLDTKQGEEPPPWVLRLLFQLSEKERRKLASDLHDSALQDQLLWYRKLEAISHDDKQLPTAIRTELEGISEGLLDVVHQIRETCNELRPPFLKEMGVIEAIENLCSHAQLNANYTISFNHQAFRVEMGDEHVLALYRITQELLRNGMKHSKATRVELMLHYHKRQIYYRYKDNGVGMEMERLQTSFEHMGLSGIRERVSGLEGETYFRTALGQGLEIEIIIPLGDAEGAEFRGSGEESA
ncbi:ATP-binding protein [Paenibacillus sp. MMS18-CY102]|uniref:ATP-binding protein n=1 Tax=Paenibacillus sp. MMS18-CY102 TaxID=2682849 RepID=UPI00136639D9|nr:ATP-binding protein [Paenibacillus sp. MMS18-CY102]MWC31178.1 histidine kinase [Paenibacillus sp. MMS18-CY102]